MAGQDSLAVWSPDGMRIAFSCARKPSSWDLYLKASNGSGAEDVLLEPPSGEIAQDWSSDGRFLINQPVNEATATPITLLMNWNPAAKK